MFKSVAKIETCSLISIEPKIIIKEIRPNKSKNFIHALKRIMKRDFELKNVITDGNCYYRAISLSLYGTEENHQDIRKRIIDYSIKNLRGTPETIQSFNKFIKENYVSYYLKARKKAFTSRSSKFIFKRI